MFSTPQWVHDSLVKASVLFLRGSCPSVQVCPAVDLRESRNMSINHGLWRQLAELRWPRSEKIVGDGEFATLLCQQSITVDEDDEYPSYPPIYLSATRNEAKQKAETAPCSVCARKGFRAKHQVLSVRDALAQPNARIQELLERIGSLEEEETLAKENPILRFPKPNPN